MERRKNNNIKYAIITLCLIIFAVSLFFLFKEKTTTISTEQDLDSISPIICKSTQPSIESFLKDNSASAIYTVKYTFKNGRADKVSFTYNGSYNSLEDARYADASAHADYNIFMSAASKSPESFSPSFSHTDLTMQINLFGEVEQLTNLTAKLFYIDSDTFSKIDFSSLESVIKSYEDKNFSCTFNK